MKEEFSIQTMKNVDIKGKVKIQVFEGENLIQEVKQNNYVNKRAREAVGAIIASGRADTVGFSLHRNTNTSLYSPPTVLSLFYNELPPNPEGNEVPIGDFVGYGRIDTSTISPTNGMFNPIESIIDRINYRKLVFDFPTSSANGKFNNIYSLAEGRNGGLLPLSASYYFQSLGSGPLVTPVFTDTKMFLLLRDSTDKNGTANKIVEINRNKIHKLYNQTLQPSEYTIHQLSMSISGLTVSDGYLYFFEKDTRNLRRSPVTNPTNVTLVKAYTSTELYDNRYIQIIKNPTKSLFYIMVNWTSQPTAGSCYVVDSSTFNIVDRFNHPGMSQDGYFHFAFDPSGTYLAKSNVVVDVVTKRRVNDIGLYIDRQGPYGMAIYSSHESNAAFDSAHCFSRLVLESEVIKTASQTMKITYEFTMDEPTWGL